MNNCFTKIDEFIISNKLINKGDKILLALSGGGDSVFLFHYFLNKKEDYDFEFECLHVNHNLRGEDSFNDEVFCIELCKNHDIPITVCSIDVKQFASENKKSIEDAARILRYKELMSIKEKSGFSKIATAHNLDDNIETIFLRIIEGTGLKGLTGIPVIRNGYIIRPLLTTTKKEIIDYLDSQKINYIFDKSNNDINYKRNFIRHKLIPTIENLNPSYQVGMLKTINILKGVSDYYYCGIDEIIRNNIIENDVTISINNNLFSFNNPIIYAECIKICMERTFSYRFDSSDFEKLEDLKKLQVGKYLELKDEIVLLKDREKTFIYKRKVDDFSTIKLNIGETLLIDRRKIFTKLYDIREIDIRSKKKNEEFFDMLTINPDKLYVRNWELGDTFTPLGMKGKKKISDFLTDQKSDAYTKRQQKVLVNVNEIIYLIGYRINDKYKITEKTKKVLKLWID